jgi:hypothetical protein
MGKLNKRVSKLEADVELIKKALVGDNSVPDKWVPTCPLCSGAVSKSTTFSNILCRQENGACGEFWASLERRRGQSPYEPRLYFQRTIANEYTLEVRIMKPSYNRLFHLYFIGGDQVTREEYEAAGKGQG